MEKGIAGLEIKPAEERTNQAFRIGVKKGREVFCFWFFWIYFWEKRAGGRCEERHRRRIWLRVMPEPR